MSNEIEAAARGLIEAIERADTRYWPLVIGAEVDALRSALAHATRGDGDGPFRRACDRIYDMESSRFATPHAYVDWVDETIRHARDEEVREIEASTRPTPPPATGMKCWRDVEGTLPARRDGDKVARIDPETAIPKPSGWDAPPATGEALAAECADVFVAARKKWDVEHGYAPATGEAGTRGEIRAIAAAQREQSRASKTVAAALAIVDALPCHITGADGHTPEQWTSCHTCRARRAIRTPQDERESAIREAESRADAALEKVARAYGYERAWVAPSGEPNIILERPHPSAKGMIEVTRLDLVVHIARAVADRMTPATESKPS